VCGGHVGIGDLDSVDLSPWRQGVRPRPNAAGDLAHGDASDEEGVRDKRAMTAPWNRLRAHQHDVLVLREIDTPFQTSSECGGLHVVGIPAEARIPPPAVDGVAPGVPQSAQTGHVLVSNPGATQNGIERLTIELRVVARSGNRADIDHTIDAVGGEQTDEFVDRSCGMPNCKDNER
jgi:hypothetical protein